MSGSDAPDPPPRFVPQRALPPYSYVTGRFPHPTRDAAGHSFAHAPPRPAPIVPERWIESDAYLWGCDLFNHGYYWEAHEEWEGAWQACGRKGTTADFLKGLIKLAAAGVKVREGRPSGVERHAARAVELFQGVRSIVGNRYLGLDVDGLIDVARQLPAHVQLPDRRAPVEIVFDFLIVPDR